ncbi:flippase [bacterium]|nr:flippase [bacterium]MBU3956396.1 flippase [bacterium]
MNGYSPFRSVIKGAGFVFAGNFILYVIGFCYHIPVVRILGPEKYGLWQLVYTIVTTIGPLSLLGLGSGVLFYYSHAQAEGKDAVEILSVALRILLISTVSAVIIAQVVNFYYIEKVYHYEGIKTLLFIFTFAIPFLAVERMGESIFKAAGNARMPYQVKIFQDSLKLVVIPVVLWMTTGNLKAMASLTLLSFIAAAVYEGALINKHVAPIKEIIIHSGKKYAGRLLGYSWPLLVVDYVQILGKKIDIFFIGYFLNSSAVGIYTPAVILSNLLWIVPQAITYLLFPALNRLNYEGKSEEFVSVSERVFKYMIYLNMPALCFVAVFSGNILKFLYGAQFSAGYLALIILSASMALQIFYPISYYVLGINKKTRLVMAINIAGMLSNVIANYFMIPVYGITGAAATTFASSMLMGVLAIIAAVKLQGKFIFPWRAIGIVLLSGAVLLFVWFCRERTLLFNLMLFTGYFILIGMHGLLFEKEEIKKGIAFIRNKIAI